MTPRCALVKALFPQTFVITKCMGTKCVGLYDTRPIYWIRALAVCFQRVWRRRGIARIAVHVGRTAIARVRSL